MTEPAFIRDSNIDILKGIGIILVVVGHSGCPQLLFDCISSFHMPLFLMASGFFFKETYLYDKRLFLKKKLKGIYIPYLKWSVIFLILHNLFFRCGIINSLYGSSTSVAHMYTLKEILSRIIKITFAMTGHDGFLLGAYWFMRALFVGSILFCFCSWLASKLFANTKMAILAVTISFYFLGGGLSFYRIHPSFFPAGFYRETMAVFFIGCGWILNNKKDYLCRIPVVLIALIIFIFCMVIHPTAFGTDSNIYDWIVIPFSGISGFIILYFFSTYISDLKCSSALVYIGKNTLYILTFHFLMFKPAAFLYAYVYNLDWHVIGCHPVAYLVHDNWFWIIFKHMTKF